MDSFILLATTTATHGAEGAAAATEAAGHGGEHSLPELPFITQIIDAFTHNSVRNFFEGITKTYWEMKAGPLDLCFKIDYHSVMVVMAAYFGLLFLLMISLLANKGAAIRPTSRLYTLWEMVVGGLYDFFGNIIGKKHINQHIWLVGTLFIYIFCMNWGGIILGGKSASANLSHNITLAAIVLIWVEFTEISKNGFIQWFKHLSGFAYGISFPMNYILACLFIPLHLVEKVIRPVSLCLRLFGNIMGEDVLLGVFGVLLPAMIASGAKMEWLQAAFPLHIPFLFLSMLTGTIQALIFSLLTSVYIMLALPHDEHEHSEEHKEHKHSAKLVTAK